MSKELSPRQKRFVKEYLIDGNATRAYLKAGYKCTEAAAAVSAHAFLRKPNIKFEIEKGQQEQAEKLDITVERLLNEEKCLAFSDFRGIFKKGSRINPSELPEELARAISGLEIIEGREETKYKYRFWDKGKSLERLERFMGMFKDKGDSSNMTLLAPEPIRKHPRVNGSSE